MIARVRVRDSAAFGGLAALSIGRAAAGAPGGRGGAGSSQVSNPVLLQVKYFA
jgi:hypothetical protein